MQDEGEHMCNLFKLIAKQFKGSPAQTDPGRLHHNSEGDALAEATAIFRAMIPIEGF